MRYKAPSIIREQYSLLHSENCLSVSELVFKHIGTDKQIHKYLDRQVTTKANKVLHCFNVPKMCLGSERR